MRTIISMDYSIDFVRECELGCLETVKYYLEKEKNNIDININNDAAFRFACENGHLDIVKLLLSVNNNIDIHNCGDWAFRCSCYNNHLHVVKYLFFISNGGIDVHMFEDEVFRVICRKSNIQIINYLLEYHLNDNRYDFYYYYDKSYYIVKNLDTNYENKCFKHKIYNNFKIYYENEVYLDKALKEYEKYYEKFNKKSARK